MVPKLSIIIVVKDNLVGFDLTYNSLLKKSYVNISDVEIIVIDSSIDRIDFNLYLINYHYMIPSGVFSAMNYGVEKASGKYVYFLNTSDKILIDSNVLLKLIDVEDIYYFNINSNNRIEFPLPLAFLKLGEIPFSHQGVIVKRDYCFFSHQLKNVADMDLFLRLYMDNKEFKYINITLSEIAPMLFARKYRLRQFLETNKVLFKNNLFVLFLIRFLLTSFLKKIFKPNYIE